MKEERYVERKGNIIYNVTIKVEHSIAAAWFDWMIHVHIPEVMATGCFTDYRMVRLLETDDQEGPTYAVQYSSQSKADYNRYIELYAEGLRNKSYAQWGEKFIAFRSVMEVVQ